MNIALSGYGKMGKTIEQIAIAKGHEISFKIDSQNFDWTLLNNDNTDVVIEFSTPDSVIQNIQSCFKQGIPVVIGTTGWYEKLDEIEQLTKTLDQSAIWASNFSIGVNLFFKLNELLAKMMSDYPDYTAKIEETHHIHKLDAPSGTGISLAKGLISENKNYDNWSKGHSNAEKTLSVISHRIDEVPGTHQISYSSEIDEILIEHKAKSRLGFAAGAIYSAEWIKAKKGFFNISDALAVNLS